MKVELTEWKTQSLAGFWFISRWPHIEFVWNRLLLISYVKLMTPLSLSLSISLISFAKYVNENEGVFGRRQDIETCNTSWVIITFERESERDKGEIKLDGIKSCYMFIPSILDRCFLTFPSQPLQCNDTLKTTTWNQNISNYTDEFDCKSLEP